MGPPNVILDLPASSEDPLSGFLKPLNMAVHLVPLVAPRLRRLPLSRKADGSAKEICWRPVVQHCCEEADKGSIILKVLSAYDNLQFNLHLRADYYYSLMDTCVAGVCFLQFV